MSGYDEHEVGVADFDQLHAQAIDALRGADTFLLAVPRYEDDGDIRLEIVGGGRSFTSFRTAVAAVLNADSWGEIEAFLRRDRWLRRALIAAALANVILIVFNFVRLVA